MSIALTVNGVTFDYPKAGDQNWGPEASDWAVAITSGMLQKAGGLFQLLSEVDFGSSFGLKSLYFKTRATNPASTGNFRLGNDETISWRNAANDADLPLKVNSSNVLEFDGAGISVGGDPVQTEITVSDTATIDLTLAASNISAAIVSGSITNAMINASAAIAYSKLNLSASIANSDLVTMAESTIKGRAASSGTGAPVDLSATQATAILNNFVGDSGSGGTKGLVPAPAAGDAAASKFLSANGTWLAPSGSGDVVGPASSVSGQIARFGDTSGKLLTATPATISNSDVNASAAIAYSKLNLTTSIVNGDVATSAGIALTKLAAMTASRAVVSDGSGFLVPATTTSTEIGYVNGVTSAIQTQLNTKVTNPMTTGGDIIYGGASGTPTRLANGSAAQVLSSAGGTSAPTWATVGAIYQQKNLASSVTSITTVQTISGLTMNGLTTGRVYRFEAQVEWQSDSANPSLVIEAVHNSTAIAQYRYRNDDHTALRSEDVAYLTAVFVAAASTVTITVLGATGTFAVNGNGSARTNSRITEFAPNMMTVTTAFT